LALMADVTAPAAPPLGRIKGVEILHVGEWDISTGTTQVTLDVLHAMVAATDCPAVRNATLKPGHKRPLMQGDPSLGYVANLRLEDEYKLVGDWCAMPGWLVEPDGNGDAVIAGAYADRSAEWAPYVCQLGHTHPCVLGAVALLGVEHPGIGTLESLHDLYTAPPVPAAAAAAKGADMPQKINAGAVSTDDVRRAYYERPETTWDEWIEEMQLDPLQLITVDDATGKHYRVPVSVTGDNAFEFGAKTEVRVEYVDAAVQAAAVAAGRRVLFASRAESRPTSPRPNEPGPSVAAGGATTNQEGAGMDPAKLREALGLQADASDEQVSAALAENNLVPAPAPTDAPPDDSAPADVQAAVNAAVERALTPVLTELGRTSQELAEIKTAEAAKTKRDLFDVAVAEGRLAPAERTEWEKNYDEAPAVTARILAARAKGSAVPVGAATGYTGSDEPAGDAEFDGIIANLRGGA
jgi:hypothetical protein